MGPSRERDAAIEYALRVWGYKQGEQVSLLIHLGDRLGLYRALAGAGRVTAGDLAERTGLHERWVLEWLRGQAAAGLLLTDDGETFELPAEGVQVLADEEGSLLFAAGAFGGGIERSVVDGLAEAFRSGIGLPYDELGPSAAHQMERTLAPWTRLALVPVVVPALEGVEACLEAGGSVADIGCGAGLALVALARAYPSSRFVGYDPSRHAVERARANVAAAGLDNVEVLERRAEDLGADDGPFDLVLALDCLHDMTRPDEAAAAVRRVIAEDGTWLIKEVRSGTTWAENTRNPMLAMLYASSVITCMSSALAEPGGAGLGTLGLPPERLERLVRDAGFGRFRMFDVEDPANLYYEVRP